VITPHGRAELISAPVDPGDLRPILLAIGGPLETPPQIGALQAALGIYGEAAALPLSCVSDTPDLRLETLAALVDEVIAARYADRPIVLFGTSMAATLALASRAPQVARIVAVEPILSLAEGSPLVPYLRRALARRPELAPIVEALFGVAPAGQEARDYGGLVEALAAPAHVLLGAPAAAGTERPDLPSLAGAAERRLLGAHPRVSLQIAADMGHEPFGASGGIVLELLREACRRASDAPGYDVRRVDEPLLDATPLDAERLAYQGPAPDAFRTALAARSPATCFVEADDPRLDALVLGELPSHARLAELLERVSPRARIAARQRLAEPGGEAPRLKELGLRVRPHPSAGASAVAHLTREAAAAPLFLQVSSFAPLLMDVRGRLPARWLGSAADLQVVYQVPPFAPALLPPDRPKVMVLQRPADGARDEWLKWMDELAAQGWVIVMELDDHPGLIRELVGEKGFSASSDPSVFKPLAWVHAVQTSTETLARDFRRSNPEVAVFPNAVFELGPEPQAPRPRRVFYGALSRGDEARRVAASLAPFTREFPDVEFTVVGDREVFDALPARAKTLLPLMSYEAYLARLGACAVSLSPLADLAWRDTKSDAKYLDAARCGVVTIASPTVYAQTIVQGETGFLAHTLEDWPARLLELFRDPQLMARIGRAAWADVRENWMFAAQVPARRAWYLDLWRRRAELEAARQARLRR
jgi:glycosyltransferase involved in cell wall biosynthesis